MKFICERDVLKEGMAAISGRTKHGKNIPILGHVLIEASDASVRLTGNDMSACSVIEIPADVSQPGEYTLPADRLGKLVSGLPLGAQVCVEREGNAPLAKIRAGRSAYSFGGLPASDFPGAFTVQDPCELVLTRSEVNRILKVPAPSVCDEAARLYLSGIYLHPERGRLVGVASNGHTLIRTSVDCVAAKFTGVIIPAAACDEIVRLASDGDVTVRVTASLIEVETGKRRFVSKLVDGTFPDYHRTIPQSNPPAFAVDVAELDAALARLAGAGEGGRGVKFSWDAKAEVLKLQRRTDQGEGNEEIPCDCEGRPSPGEAGFNVDYVRMLIAASGGEVVRLHIDGPGEPARVTNPADADFVSVMMPLRV
jgi:DNA polymerase-3 subunit beta